MHRIRFSPGRQREAQVAQVLPGQAYVRHHVPIENNMGRRLTSRAVSRSAVVLILLGVFMGLVSLTNPLSIGMATATLLIGVAMIAIASFAGL